VARLAQGVEVLRMRGWPGRQQADFCCESPLSHSGRIW